ncbi:hypothetical protein [Wukongibacter sp. M2B1]|uniref:hypothetical protein n=1 Tax=Wukongibacter sp. M2B1 TaxID=3088895 RepID=UPI003D79A857
MPNNVKYISTDNIQRELIRLGGISKDNRLITADEFNKTSSLIFDNLNITNHRRVSTSK